jgi:hypothetical protein
MDCAQARLGATRRSIWQVVFGLEVRLRRWALKGAKLQFTAWNTHPRMASAKSVGDRPDARTELWSRDRGVGT